MTPASWNYTVYTLISFVACVSPIKGERREGDGIAELISPTEEAIFYHFLSTRVFKYAPKSTDCV